MGRIIKETAQLDMGRAKLVVFANAVEDNPFLMAGAFHGVGEADEVINVGTGPGVVACLGASVVRALTCG